MFHLEDSTFTRMMSLFFWVNHNGSWLLGLVLLVVGETPILRLNSIRWSTQPMAKLMVRLLRVCIQVWLVSIPTPQTNMIIEHKNMLKMCISY